MNHALRPLTWGVFFINDSLGWSIDYRIYTTTDGGGSWNLSDAPFNSKGYHSVYFINADVGWVLAGNGVIMKSTDGGNHWDTQKDNLPGGLAVIYFRTDQIGWVAGEVVLTTNDGGLQWDPVSGFPVYYPFRKIFFVDDSHGFMCSEITLMATSDSGVTWEYRTVPESTFVFDCIFRDTLTGWIAGVLGGPDPHSRISITRDGGYSWQVQFDKDDDHMNSLSFAGPNDIWAVGYRSTVKTTNNGTTAVEENTGRIIDTYTLEQNFPNPFNSSTSISYSVPASGYLSVGVVNVLGQEVIRIVDGYHKPGVYMKTIDASSLASGVYLLRLIGVDAVLNKKMLLIR